MFKDQSHTVDGFTGVRDVHVGLDIGGPPGTPVKAWAGGKVLHSGYNPDAGDYGNVIVTEHSLGGVAVYARPKINHVICWVTGRGLRALTVGRVVRETHRNPGLLCPVCAQFHRDRSVAV